MWARLADPAMWPSERLFFELYGRALQGDPGTAGLLDGIVESWIGPIAAMRGAQGMTEAQARARARLEVATTCRPAPRPPRRPATATASTRRSSSSSPWHSRRRLLRDGGTHRSRPDRGAARPQWLTAALGLRFPGVARRGRHSGAGRGTAVDQTRFRIECDGESRPGSRRRSAPRATSPSSDGRSRTSARPRPASTATSPPSGVHTLRSVYADVNPETRHGVVITEDVIEAGGTFLDALSPYSPDQVAASLEELARFTRRRGPTSVAGRPWLAPRRGAPYFEMRGVKEIRKNFEGPPGRDVPDDVRSPSACSTRSDARGAARAPAGPSSTATRTSATSSSTPAAGRARRLADACSTATGPPTSATTSRPRSNRPSGDAERDLLTHYLDALAGSRSQAARPRPRGPTTAGASRTGCSCGRSRSSCSPTSSRPSSAASASPPTTSTRTGSSASDLGGQDQHAGRDHRRRARRSVHGQAPARRGVRRLRAPREDATASAAPGTRNRYPGCECDVPSALYSFSFDVQARLVEAVRHPARDPRVHARHRRQVRRRSRTAASATSVRRARLGRADRARGRSTLDSGETVEADVVVSAIGMFNDLAWPDIEGLDALRGHDVPLRRSGTGTTTWPASASR